MGDVIKLNQRGIYRLTAQPCRLFAGLYQQHLSSGSTPVPAPQTGRFRARRPNPYRCPHRTRDVTPSQQGNRPGRQLCASVEFNEEEVFIGGEGYLAPNFQ